MKRAILVGLFAAAGLLAGTVWLFSGRTEPAMPPASVPPQPAHAAKPDLITLLRQMSPKVHQVLYADMPVSPGSGGAEASGGFSVGVFADRVSEQEATTITDTAAFWASRETGSLNPKGRVDFYYASDAYEAFGRDAVAATVLAGEGRRRPTKQGFFLSPSHQRASLSRQFNMYANDVRGRVRHPRQMDDTGTMTYKWLNSLSSVPELLFELCEGYGNFAGNAAPWECFPEAKHAQLTAEGAYEGGRLVAEPLLGTGFRTVATVEVDRAGAFVLGRELAKSQGRRQQLRQQHEALVEKLDAGELSAEDYVRQLEELNTEMYATYEEAVAAAREQFQLFQVDKVLPTKVPQCLYFDALQVLFNHSLEAKGISPLAVQSRRTLDLGTGVVRSIMHDGGALPEVLFEVCEVYGNFRPGTNYWQYLTDLSGFELTASRYVGQEPEEVAQISGDREACLALAEEMAKSEEQRQALRREHEALVRMRRLPEISGKEYEAKLGELNEKMFAIYRDAFEKVRRRFQRVNLSRNLSTDVPLHLYFEKP